MKIFTKLYENNTMVKEGHSPSMKNLVASVSLRYVRLTDGRVLPNDPYTCGTCSKTALIKPFVDAIGLINQPNKLL